MHLDADGNPYWDFASVQTVTPSDVLDGLKTYLGNVAAGDTYSDDQLTSLLAVESASQASQLKSSVVVSDHPDLVEVNGASGQVPSANVVAYNENASVLDQVAITRDTTASFAFVSRAGVLTAVDSAHLDAAVSGVVDEVAYSGIDASFDTSAVINSVTIKWLRYTPASGTTEASTEEITYGPYEDAASIDEWGFQPAEFTMQGVENAATILAKANAILAANKTPQRRIKTVSVPIRYLEDLNPGKALLDLYDLVQLGYARTGTNAPARVISVSHKITPLRWTMELGFTPDGSVAAPQAVPSPPPSVESSATPAVAMYLTANWTHATSAAFLAIPFNGTDIAGGITWDATAMDLTVPAAGLYLVTGGIWWNASATGNRYMRLMKNGVLSLRTGPLAGSVALQNFLTAVVQCAAGDKLQLQAYQNSGGSLVAAGDTNRPTYVQIAKIG